MKRLNVLKLLDSSFKMSITKKELLKCWVRKWKFYFILLNEILMFILLLVSKPFFVSESQIPMFQI